MIDSFFGVHRFLSNFYKTPTPVCDNEGIEYPTVEHAYQASKTDDLEIREAFAKLKSPYDAKKFGQEVECRPNWETARIPIMRDLLMRKFNMPLMRHRLIATYPHELVEGNTWHDNFWGNCFCGRKACLAPGKNWLGFHLDAIRWQHVRYEQSEQAMEPTRYYTV